MKPGFANVHFRINLKKKKKKKIRSLIGPFSFERRTGLVNVPESFFVHWPKAYGYMEMQF